MQQPRSPSAPPSRSWDLSVVALLAANAIPVVGVLFWGWDAGRIVFLYWFENVVVGAVNVLKIIGAEGSDPPPTVGEPSGVEARNLRKLQQAPKALLVPFFIVHYGMFTLVHGIFLFVFFASADGVHGLGGDPFAGASDLVSRVLSDGGLWAAIALIASHLYSFGANYVVGGEWRQKSPSQVMMAPYGRVVALHLAILFGGMAVQLLGNPMPLLLLLVGGKTVLDLVLHWRSHRTEPSAS